MKNNNRIDFIDKKILFEIQRDGRIAIVDLADRINLSKTPCLKRLRRLEKQGYIKGYRAELDAEKIAQGYLVYVQVKLKSTGRGALEKFNQSVQDVPQILTCHMMSGGYDYLLKIRTPDMHSYRDLLGDVISNLPGIDQTSTFPVIEQVKETSILMVDHA